jgi:hypothetical protein
MFILLGRGIIWLPLFILIKIDDKLRQLAPKVLKIGRKIK